MNPGETSPAASAPTTAWRSDGAQIAAIGAAVFAVALFYPTMFSDGDTNWQVAAGRWILAHRAVPAVDPFSYTNAGRPWVTHEWLSEALFGAAYALAGWSGVALLTAAATAAAMALLAREARRWLGALSTLAAVALSFTVLLGHVMARPHILALPILVWWTAQLMRARARNGLPGLWLLPVMVVWANLHGSYIFGLAFTGFFAAEAVIAAGERRVGAAVRWGLFILAAAAMALLTPNGVAGLIHPVEVISMKGLTWINEWNPASFAALTPLEFALLVTLFVGLYRGVRVPPVRLGLILLLLHMSLQHIRQELILACVAPLLLAEPMGAALGARRAAPYGAPLGGAAAMALAAAAVLALGAWRIAWPVVRRDSSLVPVTALAHVPAALRARPVFNDYSFGGWLIFNGVKPFIDGRADMYGDRFFKEYLYVAGGNRGPVAKTFARYDIAWTILRPGSPLAAVIDATPGWRRLYADKWAVVQVRADAIPAGPGPAAPSPAAPSPAAPAAAPAR